MPIVERTINDLPSLDENRINMLRDMKDEDIDTTDMPALRPEELVRFVPAKLLNHSLYRSAEISVIK